MGQTTQEVGQGSIFSPEERRNIVRSFVAAYLRGDIKVTFWSQPVTMLSTNKAITPAERLQTKAGFVDMISIVSGARILSAVTGTAPQFSSDELVTAIDALFRAIVSLRSGGFIEGEFLHSPEFETRLSTLEEEVASIEKLLQELQMIIRLGRSSDSPP